MATQLHKPIYRETEINGKAFIVGLDPARGVTYREKGKRNKATAVPLAALLDKEPGAAAAAAPTAGLEGINYSDLCDRIKGMPQGAELMAIVNDIYEVNLLASDLSDAEIKARGVTVPE